MNNPDDPARRQLAMAHRHWADTTSSYVAFPRQALEGSIPERFEQVVSLHADRVAVRSGDVFLTYAALNQQANRLAHALLARPGGRNDPVALLLESGVAAIAAILGTLKAGKAYASLDPANPAAYLDALLQDSQAEVIVSDRRNAALADELAAKQGPARQALTVVRLDEMDARLPDGNPGLAIPPEALATLLYTSGSTGRPKGVMKDHRSILHTAATNIDMYRLCCDDRQPFLFSYSFARSLGPTYSSLLSGATLLLGDLKAIGTAHLAEWLIERRATLVALVPGLLTQVVEALPQADVRRFPDLRLLALSGAPITRQEIALWRQHFAPDSVLGYGLASSEAGTVARLFLDKESPFPNNPIPVGYASDDKESVLVDERGSPVECGQMGEIVVRSRFLSPGYWRKPALTAAVFRPDPEGGDQRLYFSGDLGRFQEDGALEFAGRKDLQVKVRGHTVQVAEVEMALLDTPAVAEAVVVARPGRGGGQRLIAYAVAGTQPAPTVHDLRMALKDRLPPYMIPSAFVYLDALPRGSSGKIDRQVLPPPGRGRPDLAGPFVASRTELEARIAGVWAELLELDEVGVEDDFFELGGDSLSAMEMVLDVEQLAGQPVPAEYFRAPTIAALARWCDSGTLPGESSPKAAERQPQTAPDPSRRRLSRLLAGQISANAMARRVVRECVMRLPYEQGLRWLAWVGQPRIASRLFPEERELFRRLARDLGYPAAASEDAFRASVIGNVLWLCHQQTWSNTQRLPGGLVEAMHSAPERFWRSFANRIDQATGEGRGCVVRFSGLEHLLRARRLGRGTILLTYHSPAAPFANAILSRYTGLARIVTISQESAQRLAERERADDGAGFGQRTAVWSATFALQGQRILKAGGVVQIVNDVSYDDGNCLRKCVGGRSYDLKPGFAELALATGAAVLPVHCAFDPVGRVRMSILPALALLGGDVAHPARVHHLLDLYVAFLESAWRQAPESVGWGSLRRYYSRPLASSNDLVSPITPP